MLAQPVCCSSKIAATLSMSSTSYSSNPLILLKNLGKSYQLGNEVVSALKQISLTIDYGESLAIMGPSGSGKSTLLQLLGCLDTPTTGDYFLNKRNVAGLNDTELALTRACQIGFVFQSFHLIPQLNIFENVAMPFLYQPFHLTKKEIHTRVFHAIEQVHMQHRLAHLPSQLSGGEMQRVAIARAIAIQPLILLADEPTGNLDRKTGTHILELFQKLNSEGTTLVLVTHDKAIASSCKRIIFLNDGMLER